LDQSVIFGEQKPITIIDPKHFLGYCVSSFTTYSHSLNYLLIIAIYTDLKFVKNYLLVKTRSKK